MDKVRQARLFVVDINGQHRRRIPTHFEPGTTVIVCWSPDGSRLALTAHRHGDKGNSIVLENLEGPNYHFRKLPLPPAEGTSRSATGGRSPRGSRSGPTTARVVSATESKESRERLTLNSGMWHLQ